MIGGIEHLPYKKYRLIIVDSSAYSYITRRSGQSKLFTITKYRSTPGSRFHHLICRKQAQNADHLKPTPHVIHKGLELSDQLFNRRATAIVQQALTPGAVVFSFSRLLFKSRHETYRVIRDQMEDIDGVKHISHNQMQICSLKFCLFMLRTAK